MKLDSDNTASNNYEELLSALEVWTERLAKKGPRVIPLIHLSMEDYLKRRLPESEPCIDFKHQQNYK
jgi:hypothetical protein